MIRYCVLLILLSACIARKPLRGCYSRGDGMMSLESFCFSGTDSFRHQSADFNDISYAYGAGTYRRSGRKLTLRYGWMQPQGSPPPRLQFTARSDSSVVVALQVRDTSGFPLPFVTVRVHDQQALTDSAGRARFRWIKAGEPDTLQGSLLGYPEVAYAFPRAGTYALEFLLAPAGTTQIFRGERSFRLKGPQRHRLQLAQYVPGEDPGRAHYYTYRRAKKR